MIKNRGKLSQESKDAAFLGPNGHQNGIVNDKEKKDLNHNGNFDVTISDVKDVHMRETEGLSALEVEKINARRALRVASWSTVFYLITTDILGPFNAPYAIANLGIVPGVLLYFFFGIIAFITGLIISYLYAKLDSDRYPVRT